jgi:hypothetical protein
VKRVLVSVKLPTKAASLIETATALAERTAAECGVAREMRVRNRNIDADLRCGGLDEVLHA